MHLVKYSVVIPVYRGELTLEKLTMEIVSFFNSEKLTFELIFIDDLAGDNSWSVINSLKNKYGNLVRGIRLTHNFGQHNALICGIRNATGEFLITMDEDLQQSPSDIRSLIDKQKESDYDLVYGRFGRLRHNKFRNLTSFLLKKLLRIGLPGLHPDYSAFRLIKGEVAKKAISKATSYAFLDVFFPMRDNKISSIEVKHSKREAGRSSYSIPKLINHSVNIFINYSVPFVRVSAWIVLLLLFLSFAYGGYSELQYIINQTGLSGDSDLFEIAPDCLLLCVLVFLSIYVATVFWNILNTRKAGYSVRDNI